MQVRAKPGGETYGDPRDAGLPNPPHALWAVTPRASAQLPVTAQLPQWDQAETASSIKTGPFLSD